MKIWQKYQDYLFSGQWHIHTNFTDGKNSVFEYAEKAADVGIPLLAFTEHVRRKLEYDFDEFLKEVEIAKRRFSRLIILSGCEAKVLPEGTLDCDEKILNDVDYRLFAFHSFPDSIEMYLFALNKVINEWPVDAWAHPGLFFKRHKNLTLNDNELREVFQKLHKNEILLEVNSRYSLPEKDWLTIYSAVTNNGPLVSGDDVHSVKDIHRG